MKLLLIWIVFLDFFSLALRFKIGISRVMLASKIYMCFCSLPGDDALVALHHSAPQPS